jgi:hypothetical protein
MGDTIITKHASELVCDYETAMRRQFRAEASLNEAQIELQAAKSECDLLRQQLFGVDSPPEAKLEADGSTDDRSHMPRILAYLAAQPGRMAKANEIVDALGREKESSIRSALVRMAQGKDGRLTRAKRGYYRIA